MTIPENIKIEVSKAIEQLAFIDGSYNLGVWPTPDERAKWKHDLGVMHAHGDLQHVRLELVATDKTVLFEFKIKFGARRDGQRIVDSGNGIELPLIDRRKVASHRVIISQMGRDGMYKHLLCMNWSTAEPLRKRSGSSFDSEHARKITGGRQSARFYVDKNARHSVVVTQVGNKGYGFGKVLDNGIEGVFLHQRFALPSYKFKVGDRLTALLVQVPKGIQARDIRPA